jgi:AbiTii
MSSAVHDLQMAIAEGKQPLTKLLRQTKLIAAKLNLEDVEAWVDLELGG